MSLSDKNYFLKILSIPLHSSYGSAFYLEKIFIHIKIYRYAKR